MGIIFTEEQRVNIIYSISETSVCTKMQETNYKIFSQWCCTPTLLHRYFPSASNLCWCCRKERGTLLRVFWSCSKLRDYWREVRRITQKFSEPEIPEDPTYFLLHVTKIPGKTHKNSIMDHLLNVAKSCIPLTWKHTRSPSVGLWFRKVKELNRLEDFVWTIGRSRRYMIKSGLHGTFLLRQRRERILLM